MRLSLAITALVAVTSALPLSPQPVTKHSLTARDSVEDDFDIQPEPDDTKRRRAVAGRGSVGWPEDEFEIGVPAPQSFRDKKARNVDGFPEDDFEITPEADD